VNVSFSLKIFYRVVTAIAIYLCENYNSEEKLPKNDLKLRSQVIQVIQWVNIFLFAQKI
jgi:hypothetical protein